MKIGISLFEAQLNAIFTIVKSFSWANAYAEKCNPQLNAFFTTWRWGRNENSTKHQDSNMNAQFCAPHTIVLVAWVTLSALVALAAWLLWRPSTRHAKQAPGFTRSLFLVSYQRVRKAWLLAVFPSQSNTKTTQGQSCSSND